MRNKVIMITVIIGLSAGYLFAAGWSGSFQFRPNSFGVQSVVRDGRSFTILTPGENAVAGRPGLYNDYLNEPGKPLLPCWTFTLVIPQGMKVGNVRVTEQGVTGIRADFPPYPAQLPVPFSRQTLPDFVPPDPRVYTGTELWPEAHYALGPVGVKSGFRLVNITLYPVRYDPQSGSYLVSQQLRVEVDFIPDPMAEVYTLTPKQLQVFSAGVRSIVANPEDVPRFAPRVRSTDFGTYDYVIITNSTLEPHFQRLLNWRKRLGWSGIIRTTSWINSNYSGRDLQEKIRNFVRDYFNNYGTMWVLLGGDTAVVPTRRARAYCAGETGNIPCDLYYADLQYSWDANNDNIFGEYGIDTTDLYYDLYIGRASVDDTVQVRTFVNKVITHESGPPTDYLRRILLVSGFLWSNYDETQSNDSIANITPAGWSDVYIENPGNTTMVRDSLNHGFQFCHMVGHGNDYGIYHNSTAYYSTSVISGHNNGSRVGLINSIACYPGNFEVSDCLAEASHNCATGGALSVIMNSRYGWGMPPVIGPSEKLDIRFYDYFFNHDTMPIGLTHAESKEFYRDFANNSDGAWRWCYFELNYFGDPLLLMYENVPQQLNASFSSPINIGIQNFTVTVSSGSSPVAQALVCLWKGSEVYERNYTNASGQVTFTINPTTPGYMYVTASKPNYLPDLDSCQVVATRQDVGVSRIITPSGTVDYGTVLNPTAVIRNYLPVPVANVPVRMVIAGGYTSTEVISQINGNDSAVVQFTSWTASPAGNLGVRCSTMLAGDTFPNNDAVTGSVFVRYRDVGAVSVNVPATVDSGTVVSPQATVRNYGNTNETFNIRLVIAGTAYDQTRSKTLAAGAIDTVNFPTWTALERGTHVVRCSTRLNGDNNPGNDRATATTFVRVRDVGCVQVISPAGNIDSSATVPVRAKVRNYGNTTESFTLKFRITGPVNWSDNASVSNLAPGESVVVNFNDWTCGPRGSYATACSTELSGDMRSANNRATGSFNVNIHDLAVRGITSPGAQVDSGALVGVQVVVANQGTVQENAKVYVRIGSYYRDSALTAIPAGSVETVDLPAWRVSAPRGNVTVFCSTYVYNDINRSNDTLSSLTTVVVHDVGAVSIVAPTGAVDSGAVIAPRARIRNYSSVAENFSCRFTISDGYIAQISVTLPAGSDSVITFPVWNANTPGSFSTRCSTLLSSDQNPANDRVTGSVQVIGTDVGVVAIVAPVGQIDPGPVTPVVRLGNFSPAPRSFVSYLRITPLGNTTPVFADSVLVVGLPSDSVREVAFTEWNATGGRYVVRCSVGIGDRNPANDTLSAACQVVTHDAGVVALIPQGEMRPMVVAPIVRVRNYGDASEDFQVALLIVDTVSGLVVYEDSNEVSALAPGELREVRLGSWAATIGYYRLTGLLSLRGDINPQNDTLTVKLKVSPGAIGWLRRPDVPTGSKPVKAGGALAAIGTDSLFIFALKGNKTLEFYRYDVAVGLWRTMAQLPPGPSGKPVSKGGALCSDGERYIYATKGNSTLEFWRYDIINNTWERLPDVPAGAKELKGGTGLAYVRRGDTAEVYCLKGSNTLEFYVYSVAANTWYPRAQAPIGMYGKKFKFGSALCAHQNERLFAIKSSVNEFYEYSIAEDRWITRASVPDYSSSGKRSRCKDGCGLTSDGNNTLYALTGGNRDFFYCYNIENNSWIELAPMPTGPAGKRVKAGGALTFLQKQVWALRGNGTNEFYAYVPDTMSLFSAPPPRSGVAGAEPVWSGFASVSVLPNPAHHQLWLVNSTRKPVEVALFSAAGELQFRTTLGPKQHYRFDSSRLATGIYLVRVEGAGQNRSFKLIIQH
ncbi:MAG: C25 family cysteine peptidase [candidate division WOR-3 bacterium]